MTSEPPVSDAPASDAAGSAAASVGNPTRGRLGSLRLALMTAGFAAAATLVAIVAAASREPAAYRGPPIADRPGAAEASGRFVNGLSALHAAFVREGSWEGAFAEDDVNCWLAIDLPRNHSGLLPENVTEPRVDLQPRRVMISARLAIAGLRPVVTIVLGVRLREPNQLGVTVDEARLGAIPLPAGPILTWMRRRFDRLGMVTSVRRLDDRSVLVVYIPSTHEAGGPSHWLESLSIADGSVAVAGRTLVRREGDGR